MAQRGRIPTPTAIKLLEGKQKNFYQNMVLFLKHHPGIYIRCLRYQLPKLI
ncbi:hypothetical protein Ctaglu_44000 [Clostridium tagluense]|uniref:Uncharacterized protein n=1 Tax=Clostridium tagluense TaxID=360422 RepID=A0A401UTB1_9CLOT|nr:hypothetical protein Ctaglu_44000 [Clostridium tagluense]